MTTNLTIAKTIVQQLGNSTLFMLGVKKGELVGSENSLNFKIRGCHKISHILIRLDPSDTYTLEFIKCRNHKRTIIETCSDIYAENLHDCIQRVTGLATKMPRIVGINA